MEVDLAELILATVAWLARRSCRSHEFLVRAGFEETRLLPRERLLSSLEPVLKSRVKSDNLRVERVPGLR